jgi:hypothetical protein
MKLSDLKNVRNLRILKELIILEKYVEISKTYKFLLDPNTYKESGSNLVFNVECLSLVYQKRNFGECIDSLNTMINALNSRMFKVKCNQLWDSLITTNKKDVRFCIGCSRHVFEVKNEIEFNKRKHLQQCVFFSPLITTENSDGICIVEGEFDEDLGLPFAQTGEDQNDILFPYKKALK